MQLTRATAVLLAALLYASLIADGLAASCYSSTSSFTKNDFPQCKQINPMLALHWKVDGEVMTLGVEADQVGGWVALGVSEATGGMPGGDMWVVTKDTTTGTFRVLDTYASEFAVPDNDVSQDVELLNVVESKISTAATLRRPLRTCDLDGDNRIYGNETHIWLWAMSNESWPTQHDTPNRGFFSLVLEPSTSVAVSRTGSGSSSAGAEEGLDKLEMLMPNVTITTNSTAFWCKNFKMPQDTKRHIVKIDYKINPNGLIHHISLFGCYNAPNLTNPDYTYLPGMEKDEIYDCAMSGTPPTECSAWLLNWFPGQDVIHMPTEAGMAIGPGGWPYLVLQLHYTNDQHIPDLLDDTGLYMYYTKDLRPHDMGMLWVGSMDIAIPPGMPDYQIDSAACPSECTRKFKEPLKITWHSPHMHQIGNTYFTPHLRPAEDGSLYEIAPLQIRKHYSYYFQGIGMVFPESNELLPGDALVNQCSYNSARRTNVTPWGIDSDQEMCYNFVNYYPQQDIEICYPYPGGVIKTNTTDIGYAYCATALQRAELDGHLSSEWSKMPETINSQEQFEAWAEKNIRPLFEYYAEKGWLVEFNITSHNQYKKLDLSTLSCSNKAANMQYTFAGNGAAPAAAGAGSSSKPAGSARSAAARTWGAAVGVQQQQQLLLLLLACLVLML